MRAREHHIEIFLIHYVPVPTQDINFGPFYRLDISQQAKIAKISQIYYILTLTFKLKLHIITEDKNISTICPKSIQFYLILNLL